jgi:hypothetical protein
MGKLSPLSFFVCHNVSFLQVLRAFARVGSDSSSGRLRQRKIDNVISFQKSKKVWISLQYNGLRECLENLSKDSRQNTHTIAA